MSGTKEPSPMGAFVARYTNEFQEIVAQVEERNRIRHEAGLPLINVATEVRKIFEAKRRAQFEAKYRPQIKGFIASKGGLPKELGYIAAQGWFIEKEREFLKLKGIVKPP